MFFYIEECYFFMNDPSTTKTEELCEQITQLNQTDTINTTVGAILGNITDWCSNEETNIFDFADNDKPTCQFNYRVFYKWSHFTLSVAFTIGKSLTTI